MTQSESTPVAGFVANTRELFELVRTIVQFIVSKQMVPEWMRFRDGDAACAKLLEAQKRISDRYQSLVDKGGPKAALKAVRAKFSKAIELTQLAEEHLAYAWISEKKDQLATLLASFSASLSDFEPDLAGMSLGQDRSYGHWRASSACKALEEVATRLAACLKWPGLEFQNTGVDWKKFKIDIDGECGKLGQLQPHIDANAIVRELKIATDHSFAKALKEHSEAEKAASENSPAQLTRAQVEAELTKRCAESPWGRAMLKLAHNRDGAPVGSAELIAAGEEKAGSKDSAGTRTVEECLRILRRTCGRHGGCAPCSDHLGFLDYVPGAKRGRLVLTEKGKQFVEAMLREEREAGTAAPKHHLTTG